MKTVVIFGGSGFLGQKIIRRLVQNRYKIIVPYQKQINEAKLRFLGNIGQVIPMKFYDLNDARLLNSIEQSEIILNLKTLWEEKKISFNEGITNFNLRLTEIINKNNKNSLCIFFSGLGVETNNKSKRINAISKAEDHILTNLENSVVIRPGIILGGGDQFLLKLLPLFNISFLIPIFGSGKSKFQPVYVEDITKAVEKIILNKKYYNKNNLVFELVAHDVFTYIEFYKFIAKCLNIRRYFIKIPMSVCKILVYLMKFTPLQLINNEQLRLFEKDNLKTSKHKNFKDLKIIPHDIREIVKISIKKIY